MKNAAPTSAIRKLIAVILGRRNGCTYQQSRYRYGQMPVDMRRDKAVGAVLSQRVEEAALSLQKAVRRVHVQPPLSGDVHRERLVRFGEHLNTMAQRVAAPRGRAAECVEECRSRQEDTGIDGIPLVELFPNTLDHAGCEMDLGGVIPIEHLRSIPIDGQAHLPIAERGVQHLLDQRGGDHVVCHDQQKAVVSDAIPCRESARAVAKLPVRRHHKVDVAPASRRHMREVGPHGFRLGSEHNDEAMDAGFHTGHHRPLTQREAQNLVRGLGTIPQQRQSPTFPSRKNNAARHVGWRIWIT